MELGVPWCGVVWLAFCLIPLAQHAHGGKVRVTGVSPSYGSLNGGTRLTVNGENFPDHFVASSDDSKGVVTSLVSTTEYACDAHIDGKTNITDSCYTRPMPSGVYRVAVYVDGQLVTDLCMDKPENCLFQVRDENTPKIHSVMPRSGKINTRLRVEAKMFTSRVGSNEVSQNGREEKIVKIWIGGSICDVKDFDTDQYYGLALYSDTGNEGYFICQVNDDYIGNYNLSFIVEGEFGRSLPDPAILHVFRKGIAMFETYTEITGLSAHSGSLEGGLYLTISGQHFDDTDSPAQVLIDGETCIVQNPISSTSIVCITPPLPASTRPLQIGNRGLKLTIVNGTTDYNTAVWSSGQVSLIDETYHVTRGYGAHVVKMEGALVPRDSGTYHFYLKAAGSGKLTLTDPSTGALLVTLTSSSTNGNGAQSVNVSLTSDTPYQLVVLAGSAGDSQVEVAARHYETRYLASQTGAATSETQDLVFQSTVTNEIQRLEVTSSGVVAGDEEVQVVTLTGDLDTTFRLAFYGVFTEPLKASATSSQALITALQRLPSVSGANLGITDVIQGSSRIYTVTFPSVLGDVAPLTVEMDSEACTGHVTTATEGRSTLAAFRLVFGGAVSQPINATALPSQVENALREMTGVRCHPYLTKGKTLLDCEGSACGDSGVGDEEPLCGKKAARNLALLYTGPQDLQTAPRLSTSTSTLCFGHKGPVTSWWVRYAFVDFDGNQGSDTESFTLTVPDDQLDQWRYTCKDIYSAAKARQPSKKDYFIQRIGLNRDSKSEADVFIDQLVLHEQLAANLQIEESAVKMRMPQARPNSAYVKDVSVTGQVGNYTVSITPYLCGNTFQLISVDAASEALGNVSDASDSVTLTLTSGEKQLTVRNTRLSRASPPIGGFFSVNFNGVISQSISVTSQNESIAVRDTLNMMQNMGNVDVTYSGNCSAFMYTVTMATLPGNQNSITVEGGGLTGSAVSSRVNTRTDGSLWFRPIPGDMLATVHAQPQVTVLINNVSTACASDADCTFTWSSQDTPTVTSITPTSGAANTEVIVTGLGLAPSGNKVWVGGAVCTVVSESESQVQCRLGVGPRGVQNVTLYVPGKGLAAGQVSFTFSFSLTGIAPNSGSVLGGLVLTVSGEGFTPGLEVTVGDRPCPVLTLTLTTITCTLPSSVTATRRRRQARSVSDFTGQVAVSVDGVKQTSATSFSYIVGLTPEINALSASTASAWGGETVTITGTKFGGQPPVVTINGSQAVVLSSSETQAVVQLPPLPSGTFPLILLVPGVGQALDASGFSANITVTLTVSGLSPSGGSLYGGTELTLTGAGFGNNVSAVSVTLGPTSCDVISVSDTAVTCGVAYTGTTYLVTNKGVHKDFGEGYAYDRPQLSIIEGDCVEWRWTTPTFISGIGYGVYQTANISARQPVEGGFATSEQRSANGQYKWCFTVAGDYYYWSGYVNPPYNTIYLRGQVTVTQRTSSLQELVVSVGGVAAQHVGASSAPAGSLSCGYPRPGCTPADLSPSDVNKFYFRLDDCATPTVTAISPANGTTLDTITFTGSGFGTSSCSNEVHYGGTGEGVVSSSNALQLTFAIGTAGSPPTRVMAEFTLRVGNLGNALIAIASDRGRRFAYLPLVTSLAPGSGSKAGGTIITIAGAGFTSPSVSVNGAQCTVQSQNTTLVTCFTPASQVTGEVSVSVTEGGVAVTCADNACLYTYDTSLTPSLTAISPATISSPNVDMTISGEGFGSVLEDVNVMIGGAPCVPSTVTDTQIVCGLRDLPAGTHIPQVRVYNKGLAVAGSAQGLVSQPILASLTPDQGSLHGGSLLTLIGHGFKAQSQVKVGDDACSVTAETNTSIQCVTIAHPAATVTVTVTSNGVVFPTATFTFSAVATPVVSSVSPDKGVAGDEMVISGSGFSSTADDNVVTVGGVAAMVTAANASSLTVTLGNQLTGSFDVVVVVKDSGLSNSDVKFEYTLGEISFSPIRGATAGGQVLTVSGSGFLPNATFVTLCDLPCRVVIVNESVTASVVNCMTPAKLVTTATTCSVSVTVNSVSKVAASSYTYDPAITASVTSVSPARGGTGGGTQLTVTGTGFGTSAEAVAVTIGQARCVVSAVTDTQIVCSTDPCPSGDYPVIVNVDNTGSAQLPASGGQFRYVDMWSSNATWGGESTPTTGDLVVIPEGQIILLDVDTPVLNTLIIQGSLIFDDKNLLLQAERILITNGGLLQVGTETQPFPEQYTATIKLHGHLRSRELPIYGTKVLAVRQGTLDLHGHPTPVTWTQLAATAQDGDTRITLTTPVNWKAGDQVVLPTTSHRHSQAQSEVVTVQAVSGDGLTITLQTPLQYRHLVLTHTFQDGTTVTLRGEVGLLTHNVKVVGSVNDEWTEDVPACPEGFDTGEFATQTCFQGRFGAETGSDQFGAHIIAHGPLKDSQAVVIRLSYVEVSHAGQAFRLGRYPVHLHLNGDMSRSYVRGLAIHNSFNRAVNIHGTHNALVEHVVLYNIMGGAFFLEDGVEVNNTFQYNLAVFVRPSSSLRNDDITPAAFWITNPNNIHIHNHAAGGSHFGFWYRMKDHPEGPSFDPTICPKHVPLNRFENNTAHSNGWFGLWIFEFMFPRRDGSCDSNSPTQVSVFKTLTAWNCEKGAEAVNSGALQFQGFVLVNNEKAGYEGKLLIDVPQYDEANGPMVDNATIVASLPGLDQQDSWPCTKAGIVLPYNNGLLIRNVHFYNFDRPACAAFEFTRITGTCSLYCGGFLYKTKQLTFEASNNTVRFEWESEGVLRDLDGTLTGQPGAAVLPSTPTLPPTSCTANVAEFSYGLAPGSVCGPDINFHRFAFKNPKPVSLAAKDALFTNQYGTTVGKYATKRITHKPGWMAVLIDGECYSLQFENAGHITNISYDGTYYQFSGNDYMCIKQKADRPDRFIMDGTTAITMSDPLPAPAAARHGDWWYNDTDSSLTYYIKARSSRRKRSSPAVLPNHGDVVVAFSAYQCFYDNCVPPPSPTAVKQTPENALPWSRVSTWDFRNNSKPVAGDTVVIPSDKWIVIDEELPPLDELVIEGGLSAADNPSLNLTLDVNHIIVVGRLAIGWEAAPFAGRARLVLRGSHSTPSYPHNDGPPLGAKFIAVYGGLDLHGKPSAFKWTRLAATVNDGSTLSVEDSVDWSVGDEIMLTTTDLNPWHTETFTLTGVSGTTLTLNSTVQHRHIAHTETLTSGRTVKLTSRVVRLTRNIVIEGGQYPALQNESFGARVIVGRTVYKSVSKSGFARVSNTEFVHTGQEGYTETYDPRFSLAFVDVLNDNATDFYSYVRDNSFHNGFSPAVGVFGVDNLEVSGNVIHHTIDSAIRTTSSGTQVVGNLMALTVWSGAYQDRQEDFNIKYDGTVEALGASKLTLSGNIVAGCERVAYHLAGQDCTTMPAHLWHDNEAHSCLVGAAIFPKDDAVSASCYLWSGFYLWKNADWGLYLNNAPSQRITNVLSVENTVGYFPFVVGPSANSHETDTKTVEISNSVFVGRTPSFDCQLDKLDPNDDNVKLSSRGRSFMTDCGHAAVTFPSFASGGNKAPEKPFANSMSYQAIMGHMKITNVTFELFSGSGDAAIITNPDNEDMLHPITISRSVFHNVPANNSLFYHFMDTSSIQPSDCVDMNCDALKKTLIVDTDGSLLSSPGYVLPNAGYQWDGNRAFGVGDYRIPKEMLTAQNGSRLDVGVVAPNKGVFRHAGCVYVSAWNAYKCDNSVRYAMLTIESMDEDTETRRLSPIAVLSGGYVDLLNGPQDHGWCSGYTCRKRLSTFPALVPLDRWVALYMSSTVPENLRFITLNVAPADCVGLSLWKASPYRMDFFVNGTYRLPTNGYYGADGSFFVKPEDTPGQWLPNLSQPRMGDNYVEFQSNTVYWVQCGPGILEIKTAKVLIVSFGLPAMTDVEFFGAQLINNMAQFLGVPRSKVRIVNIVRQTAARRKRSTTPGIYFFVEIGDSAVDTSSPVNLEVAMNAVVKQTHLYGMDQIVNDTVLSTTILEPSMAQDGGFVSVKVAGILVMTFNPAAQFVEGMPFSVQPQLYMLSPEGERLDSLGTASAPWEAQVTLQAGVRSARLLGTTRVLFVNGTAQFTDLALDRPAQDAALQFSVVRPVEATNYTLLTDPFQVNKRPVATLGALLTSDPEVNSPVHINFRLVDPDTNKDIKDIDWRNHSWSATASLEKPDMCDGTLQGTTTLTFDPATATADFTDLRLTAAGLCPVTFTVTSSPAEYRLSGEVEVPVLRGDQRHLQVEKTSLMELRLSVEYNDTTAKYFAYLVRNYVNQWPNIRVVRHQYRQGSVVVTLTVEGTALGTQSALQTACDAVNNHTVFTYGGVSAALSSYMTINGAPYFGVHCYPQKDEASGLHPGVIAAIVLACLIFLLIVVVLVVYKFKIQPKIKTYDTAYRTDSVVDMMYRDETFTSLKSSNGDRSPLAPVATSLERKLAPTPRLSAKPRVITPTPAFT